MSNINNGTMAENAASNIHAAAGATADAIHNAGERTAEAVRNGGEALADATRSASSEIERSVNQPGRWFVNNFTATLVGTSLTGSVFVGILWGSSKIAEALIQRTGG